MRLKLRIAVLTALLSMLGTLVVPGTVAGATEHCPSPGGSDLPFEPDLAQIDGEDDVAITGGGWGHGVGMSQYGAQGAAELGCTHDQILQTYYPETGLVDATMPETIRVGLLEATSDATVLYLNEGDPDDPGAVVRWRLSGCDPASHSDAEACGPDQPAESRDDWPDKAWKVRLTSGGAFQLLDSTGKIIWSGGSTGSSLIAHHEGSVVHLAVPGLDRRLRWGHTELKSTDQGLQAVQVITAGDGSTGMERYLWGLAEVPIGWPSEALKSQVVAARSYALIRAEGYQLKCDCHLYATVKNQHYSGWSHEERDRDSGYPWRDAVNETAGTYLQHEGHVVDAFYSSSHGGWSDAAKDVWGGDVPYLQAVDTSAWEAESDNPRQRWTNGFTDEELASRFGFDSFRELQILERGSGGRPTTQNDRVDPECGETEDEALADDGAQAIGIVDGETVHRCLDGEDLRSKLGLFSGLIHVHLLSDVPFQRLQDPEQPDRIGTATAMSQHGWPDAATTVVIARADDPADALAGATLAGEHDAPLLITFPHELHAAVAAEVERLGADRALLLGGVHALSEEVERGLEAAGVTEIQRIAGADRVGTAVDIAESLEPESATNTAYLVYSAPGDPRSWPDALAVSGTAARRSAAGAPWPVLVTGKTLPDATAEELGKLGVEEVVLIGGNAVIPAEVEQQLQDAGYTTRRLWGEDRYGTSVKVAEEDDAPPQTLLAATGDAFPDGLAAGALAGRLDVTLLLVPSSELADVSREWVSGRAWEQPRLLVAGGVVAVSDQVVRSLREALDDGTSDDATPTEDGS